jgi:glutamate synthase domain-containing protein 3
MVDPARVNPGSPEELELKALLREHVAETGSARGAHVLAQWDEALPHFWAVTPNTKPLKERSQALVHVPQWSVRAPAGTEAPATPYIPLTPRQRLSARTRTLTDKE